MSTNGDSEKPTASGASARPADARPKSPDANSFHVPSDRPFIAGLIILGGSYFVLIALLIVADFGYLFFKQGDPENPYDQGGLEALFAALADERVRYAIWLSLITCTITTVLSLWVSVPIGYIMSRFHFRGKAILDAILDIPIVLPPMVVGLSLLILFNIPPFSWTSDWVVYEVPAVIIAQFAVATAFAVRTMRVTFDQVPQRFEQVAMTLGCSRGQAFWLVVLPQTHRGLVAAGTLAWARSLGEFGPVLIFAGSTRMRTEALPTTVFLELQAGNLPGMLAVSIIMIVLAAGILIAARLFGLRRLNR